MPRLLTRHVQLVQQLERRLRADFAHVLRRVGRAHVADAQRVVGELVQAVVAGDLDGVRPQRQAAVGPDDRKRICGNRRPTDKLQLGTNTITFHILRVMK